eukprot:6190856-Pleurochrysis_carterae.AAC.7
MACSKLLISLVAVPLTQGTYGDIYNFPMKVRITCFPSIRSGTCKIMHYKLTRERDSCDGGLGCT